ncbi:hypothetical protein AVEN_25309-1 [Araneus ventricosus]|uniref:Uncharacterized protein n=1 Tax=Araneus ventricosus TaxID=182803 RepID=A0A4Y2ITG1_ARAVE|nr:hypothetical protein AVEN_25309-1 [Araneus ventricosus]
MWDTTLSPALPQSPDKQRCFGSRITRSSDPKTWLYSTMSSQIRQIEDVIVSRIKGSSDSKDTTLSPCHPSLQTNRDDIGSRISDPPIPKTPLYHHAIAVSRQTGKIYDLESAILRFQ